MSGSTTFNVNNNNNALPPAPVHDLTDLNAAQSDARTPDQIQGAFNKFLEGKKANSAKFTFTDRLRYRQVEYINAKGLAAVGAFLKCGLGFGVLFGKTLTPDEVTDLTKQAKFYRAATKTIDLFTSFNYLAESYKSAKDLEKVTQSFEGLLQDEHVLAYKGAEDAHSMVNFIVNTLAKTNVSNVLLQQKARFELTKGDEVTAETIRDTFTGLIGKVKGLHDVGYRPNMSTEERNRFKTTYANAKPGNFINFVQESKYQPFYMAYIRTYTKDSIFDETTHNIAYSLKAPTVEQVNGVRLETALRLIEVKGNIEDNTLLAIDIDPTKFSPVRDLYHAFIKSEQEAKDSAQTFSAAAESSSTAATDLEDFLKEKQVYNLSELKDIYGEPADVAAFVASLPDAEQASAQAYFTNRDAAVRLAGELQTANAAIMTRSAEITSLLVLEGALDAGLLAQRVSNRSLLKQIEGEQQQLFNELKKYKKIPPNLLFMSGELVTKTRTKQELEAQLAALEIRINELEAEQALLQASLKDGYSPNGKVVGANGLIVARDEIKTQLDAAKGFSTELTKAQIVSFADKCGAASVTQAIAKSNQELIQKAEELKSKHAQLEQEQATKVAAVVTGRDNLTANGIIIDASGKIAIPDIKVFQTAGPGTLMEKMTKDNRITSSFIKQAKVLTRPISEQNRIREEDDRKRLVATGD